MLYYLVFLLGAVFTCLFYCVWLIIKKHPPKTYAFPEKEYLDYRLGTVSASPKFSPTLADRLEGNIICDNDFF